MEKEKMQLLQTNVVPKLVDVMETVDELMLEGRPTILEMGELKRIKQLAGLARNVAKSILEKGGK